MQALDKEHVDRPENPPVEHLLGEITKTYENHKNVRKPGKLRKRTKITKTYIYRVVPIYQVIPCINWTRMSRDLFLLVHYVLKKVLQSLKLHMGYFLDIKSLNNGSSRICVASEENRPFFDILSLLMIYWAKTRTK